MRPITIPIEDTLDLHTFQPAELKPLLADYFSECLRNGIYAVRLIHGKGSGVLKRRVRSALEKDPRVTAFKDAPAQAGGWGATLVELKRPVSDPAAS